MSDLVIFLEVRCSTTDQTTHRKVSFGIELIVFAALSYLKPEHQCRLDGLEHLVKNDITDWLGATLNFRGDASL